MKEYLKKILLFKILVISHKTLKSKPNFFIKLKNLGLFFSDLSRYNKLQKNNRLICDTKDLFPRINDKTSLTQLDPVYFYQGVWCAKKIFESKPKHHFDIASQAIMVGIISQFTPTTMVDIRPLTVKLNNLNFLTGDILNLPFPDNSVESLSSICVIEHIGLGRYGDHLDQFGTEKAASELSRVLATNGNLYISVPIDKENKTYFNAHRTFTRDYVIELFNNLELIEEKYIYGNELTEKYEEARGFGTGLYHFKKR